MTTSAPNAGSFKSLLRRYYTSPEIFETELERVIFRQWILFGHRSELAEPGDVLVQQLGPESIVATRDSDGGIHAFYNVCRHRGSQLCDEGASRKSNLVCPYHRWSYGLDGALLGAPTMLDGVDIDYQDYGLRRIHVELWRGFIFVALGVEAPAVSLADGLKGVDELIDVYEPERLHFAHRTTHEVQCNWKLLVENFLECYHCPGSHPELCAVSDIAATFEIMGDPVFSAPTEFNWGHVPVADGVISHTITGARATKRQLGRVGENPELPHTVAVGTVPTMCTIQYYADYVVTHRLLPITTDRSSLICDWYVHEDAREGIDYDVDELIAVWDATNHQDLELCERNQRGVNSHSYVPGPNSAKREPAIRSALAMYHLLMGEPDHYEALSGETSPGR